MRYFLPTFVAPRYTPRTETDPVPSSNVKRVLNGLQLRALCNMTDKLAAVTSPSHQIMLVISALHSLSNSSLVSVLVVD